MGNFLVDRDAGCSWKLITEFRRRLGTLSLKIPPPDMPKLLEFLGRRNNHCLLLLCLSLTATAAKKTLHERIRQASRPAKSVYYRDCHLGSSQDMVIALDRLTEHHTGATHLGRCGHNRQHVIHACRRLEIDLHAPNDKGHNVGRLGLGMQRTL